MPNTSAKDGAFDLDDLLDRLARSGEPIVVERDGRPAAILTPLEEPAARRNHPARSSPTESEELIEANRALLESEAQLRQAHQINQLGHWSWHPETDRLSVSPEMAVILGAAPEGLAGLTNENYLERFVHPDDRARVTESSNMPTEAGRRYELEYRLIGRDGGERWVQELGEAVVDKSGREIGGVGTIQDITGRKRADTALRESEERFRGIFEQGALGIAVMSPEGHFAQVNQA
jgi:PAS domain S-box-containing protein